MFIWTTSYGQFDKLKGTWISKSNDVMIIEDTTNEYNINMLGTSEDGDVMTHFYLIGNTLSSQQHYYFTPNHKKLYIFKYNLVIIEQTDSTLTVKPSSKLAKRLFKNRQNIKFIKREYNIDTTISFEKIIYHSTDCFGSCPIIDLEIDSNKNIYFSGKFFIDDMWTVDSLKSGQFIGVLTDTLYNKLLNILKTCNLRTLDFQEIECCDAPIITLIIYFNGWRKYLRSMSPPPLANELIDFLYSINEKVVLTKTNEKRILE
jgi:hypothetical protein